MPPVPTVFADVQSFLATPGFPSVFAQLAPTTAAPVAMPSQGTADALAASDARSVVKVLGQACGYEQEGSGFVVSPGLVVTNAHVIAGEGTTQVVVGASSFGATPVLFDPSYDLAVLRTDAPLGSPLKIAPAVVSRGTQGAVVGYPHNGPLTVAPSGVSAVFTAAGRDIYNQTPVDRQVYQLDAVVEPGNSGSPVVDSDGQVIGVVFSRSTATSNIGYALTSPGVLKRIHEGSLRTKPVTTGACTEG
jgi:S1-C subfamily serine protease